jgi:hypothetical protein
MSPENNPRERIQTIRLWIKAFIPTSIEPSAIVPGSGEHGGKVMLPAPGPIRRCFLTDQRDFDDNINARARMHSEIEFDMLHGAIIHQYHQCFETIEVDCDTGEERCRESADTDKMRFHNFQVSDGGNRLSIELEGSTKNPCMEIASLKVSPNLDYDGTITVELDGERRAAVINFEGRIEIYPAFEMYVMVNGGTPETVFRAPVVPGSTALDLVGAPARPISRSIQVRV